MIKIKDLIHKYTVWESETEKSKKTVLDGISLDIPSGQFVAILGANGSGKSTLAKHLNVLLLPDEGTVWIDGKKTDLSFKEFELLSYFMENKNKIFRIRTTRSSEPVWKKMWRLGRKIRIWNRMRSRKE